MNPTRIPQASRRVFSRLTLCFVFAWMAMCHSMLRAQDERIFQLDHANFMAPDSGVTRLEIYCQFSNADLHFVKNDSGYLARIELVAVLYDESGAFIDEANISQPIFESFYSLTTAETEKKTVQFHFNTAPGLHTLHLLFTDHVTGYSFEHKVEMDVRAFPANQFSLSDIEVASSIKLAGSDTASAKNGRLIVAHPSRIFGDTFLKANFYFEIYHLDSQRGEEAVSFGLDYSVVDKNKVTVQKFSDSFLPTGEVTPLHFAVDVQKYKPGKYTLEIEVTEHQSKKRAKAQTDFTVVASPNDLPLARYDRVLNVLNLYVKEKARKSELNEPSEKSVLSLKMTGDTGRQDEQDLQMQFHQRVAYANRAFATMNRPGWKTDRGKIYIQYGQPDRVKKLEGNFGERIELWEYFQKDINFMFVDQQGFGDYLLIQNSPE
ncbi:MAG: GWxTD domain-containing protein [Candidatus Zhuqueibacterota bacterium]